MLEQTSTIQLFNEISFRSLQRQNTIIKQQGGSEEDEEVKSSESPDFLDIMERKIAEKACEVTHFLFLTKFQNSNEFFIAVTNFFYACSQVILLVCPTSFYLSSI